VGHALFHRGDVEIDFPHSSIRNPNFPNLNLNPNLTVLNSWLRTSGVPSLILAIAYALTGRLSFLAQVDNVVVTPVFFLPEGIALAFALRFGPGIWPGVFTGQLVLALIQGLSPFPALSISLINSLEAVGAWWLYRRLGGQPNPYDLRSWLVLQGLVFLVLQPFSATLGTLSLFFSGVIGDFRAWADSWQNWWIGNAVAQSQLSPLLALLLNRDARSAWPKKVLLPMAITAGVLWFALLALPGGNIGTSLALFQPVLVGFALMLGLKAVCSSSMLISLAFLYATSHGIGPFYRAEGANLIDLNVFLIGISLIAQFLAVLFHRLEESRSREKAAEQRQREEITRKLKTSLAAAGIAHEINQPLSQILLQTELSLRNLAGKTGKDSESAEAFRMIQGRAEQVVDTIETIRALLGNVASDHQTLNLADVVRSAVLYLQPALQRAGAELRTEGLDSSRMITGDDAQLHLLVSNLLRNALQAVESQPTDRRKISISLVETHGGLTLNMEDSGPGFTEEQKLRSEMPIESTKPEGMGMGLFLARTAAENHRASITFSRSPSLGGAKVTVTFPK
jgi:signal transduction histidine kinase